MNKIFYLGVIIFLTACNTSENEKQTKQDQEYVQETQVEYYPDGKLKMEGNTVNGKAHGVWRYYFENGFIWSEGRFRHGVRDGYARIYYENGKKRMQGEYDEGKKTGWWRVWNTDGSFADSINVNLALSARDSLLLGLK